MREGDKTYIISGQSREQIAAALIEYRAYIESHDDDLGLAEVVADIHAALHQRRAIGRCIG